MNEEHTHKLLAELLFMCGTIDRQNKEDFNKVLFEVDRRLKRYDYLIKRVPINKRHRDRMRKLFP